MRSVDELRCQAQTSVNGSGSSRIKKCKEAKNYAVLATIYRPSRGTYTQHRHSRAGGNPVKKTNP